jgi:hypothetical protein
LQDREAKCANIGPAIDTAIVSSASAASPRTKLVAALTEAIVATMAAGDLHAARGAHEALGRLLAAPDLGMPAVADLAAERARRGPP